MLSSCSLLARLPLACTRLSVHRCPKVHIQRRRTPPGMPGVQVHPCHLSTVSFHPLPRVIPTSARAQLVPSPPGAQVPARISPGTSWLPQAPHLPATQHPCTPLRRASRDTPVTLVLDPFGTFLRARPHTTCLGAQPMPAQLPGGQALLPSPPRPSRRGPRLPGPSPRCPCAVAQPLRPAVLSTWPYNFFTSAPT